MTKELKEVQALRTEESKLQELWQRKVTLEGEIQELKNSRERLSSGRRNSIEQEAAMMLDGGGVETATMTRTLELDGELRDKRHELHVCRSAIEMQKRIIEKRRTEASRAVAETHRDSHRDKVQRIANALVELSAACEAERTFRDELKAEGFDAVDSHLRAMSNVNKFGSLNEYGSRVNQYLLECCEFGFLTVRDLPGLGIPGHVVKDIKTVLDGRAKAEKLKENPPARPVPSIDGSDWTA